MPRRLLPWQHGATTHRNPSGEVSRSPGASAGRRRVFDVAPVVTMSVRPARSLLIVDVLGAGGPPAGLVDRAEGRPVGSGDAFALGRPRRTSERQHPACGWSPGTGARAGAGLSRIRRPRSNASAAIRPEGAPPVPVPQDMPPKENARASIAPAQ